MAHFIGMRGTGDFGTDERPKNFRESILWMNPNGNAPLFALMAKMKKETVNDPEFSWWVETNDSKYMYLDDASDMLDSDTTFVVDDGVSATDRAYMLKPGDILQVQEGAETALFPWELIKVTSVTNGTTFVAERGYAGTTATGITDDTLLVKVGSAYAEGTGAPNSATKNPTKYSNLTQIFKTPYDITRTARDAKYRTGDPLKNDRIRKSFDHSADIEFAMFFGTKHETTGSNGKPERTMNGLRKMITSNVKVYTATPTLDDFEATIAPVFDYEAGAAGNERLIFAGNGALTQLNKLVRDASHTQFNYTGPIKWYGMELHQYTLPQGKVYIKTHPLFNTHPYYTYSMFVTNPSGLVYRPYVNADTRIQKNIQAPDEDLQKDQWLTECSIEMHYEQTFGYVGNFKTFP